jgi:hypothetical protein
VASAASGSDATDMENVRWRLSTGGSIITLGGGLCT